MKEIAVTRENAGGRLDKLLAKYMDKAPKGFIYKMLRKKNIVLNGKKAAGRELLKEGDRIRLFLADETIARFRTARIPDKNRSRPALLVIYEDANIIVMDKPVGMLSQRAKASDVSLNDLLAEYLGPQQEGEGFFTPGISNRLDRNTSGLVIAGKTLYATRELNRALKDRKLGKKYLCLVQGRVMDAKTIDGYLIKDEKTNKVTVSPSPEQASSAGRQAARIKTAYQPLQYFDGATLLEVDLITGKSHQIRAHLASAHHPIIGDRKYGDKAVNAEYRERFGVDRQLLHAHRLRFEQMEGNLAYLNGREVASPLPSDFQTIINGTQRMKPYRCLRNRKNI